eukprot:4224461-Amphidinium_carterae.1
MSLRMRWHGWRLGGQSWRFSGMPLASIKTQSWLRTQCHLALSTEDRFRGVYARVFPHGAAREMYLTKLHITVIRGLVFKETGPCTIFTCVERVVLVISAVFVSDAFPKKETVSNFV